ncbi:MAG: sulfatase-like hydrolase/transferase, partial [Opitutales bacterium]|nr:sulfatase-like hydrolase/transferase [Opitutales bacterium]
QLGLAERQVERSNILFVFGENWGMDTGAYCNTVVSTLVFDRLAEEGVLFTHAFATAPSCSPSKASELTG